MFNCRHYGKVLWFASFSFVLVFGGCPSSQVEVPAESPLCGNVRCGDGTTCIDENCVDLDPCGSISCDDGAICIEGMCVPESGGALSLTIVFPSEDTINGGAQVTILGSGFFPGASVIFGDTDALDVALETDGRLVATAPAVQIAGIVDITVTSPEAQNDGDTQLQVVTLEDAFTFISDAQVVLPPPGGPDADSGPSAARQCANQLAIDACQAACRGVSAVADSVCQGACNLSGVVTGRNPVASAACNTVCDAAYTGCNRILCGACCAVCIPNPFISCCNCSGCRRECVTRRTKCKNRCQGDCDSCITDCVAACPQCIPLKTIGEPCTPIVDPCGGGVVCLLSPDDGGWACYPSLGLVQELLGVMDASELEANVSELESDFRERQAGDSVQDRQESDPPWYSPLMPDPPRLCWYSPVLGMLNRCDAFNPPRAVTHGVGLSGQAAIPVGGSVEWGVAYGSDGTFSTYFSSCWSAGLSAQFTAYYGLGTWRDMDAIGGASSVYGIDFPIPGPIEVLGVGVRGVWTSGFSDNSIQGIIDQPLCSEDKQCQSGLCFMGSCWDLACPVCPIGAVAIGEVGLSVGVPISAAACGTLLSQVHYVNPECVSNLGFDCLLGWSVIDVPAEDARQQCSISVERYEQFVHCVNKLAGCDGSFDPLCIAGLGEAPSEEQIGDCLPQLGETGWCDPFPDLHQILECFRDPTYDKCKAQCNADTDCEDDCDNCNFNLACEPNEDPCTCSDCELASCVVMQFLEGDIERWKTRAVGWGGYAFDQFYGGVGGRDCLAENGTELTLSGTNSVTITGLNEANCDLADGASSSAVSDGWLYPGGSLRMEFNPPISALYTYYGSLAVGKQVTMKLYDDADNEVGRTTSGVSVNALAIGHGFVSRVPIVRVDFVLGDGVTPDDTDLVVIGAFVGLADSNQSIGTVEIPPDGNGDSYAGPNGPTVQMDFAVVFSAP